MRVPLASVALPYSHEIEMLGCPPRYFWALRITCMIDNASSAPLLSPARRMCRARVIRGFISDLGAGVLACRAVRADLHVSNITVSTQSPARTIAAASVPGSLERFIQQRTGDLAPRQHDRNLIDCTCRSFGVHALRSLTRQESPTEANEFLRRSDPGRRSRKCHLVHWLHHGAPGQYPRRAVLSCQDGDKWTAGDWSSSAEARPVYHNGTLQQEGKWKRAMHRNHPEDWWDQSRLRRREGAGEVRWRERW